jgi:hypothetical protein
VTRTVRPAWFVKALGGKLGCSLKDLSPGSPWQKI